MTQTSKTQNAVKALLDIYKNAIEELQFTLQDLNADELIQIVDPHTDNPDCASIQTIMAHVVRSGYAYNIYIQNLKGASIPKRDLIFRTTVLAYHDDLNGVLKYTEDTFASIYDDELEVFTNEEKLMTSWGQLYDIEQIMEHAIVHLLRHKRQIERFKKIIRKQSF